MPPPDQPRDDDGTRYWEPIVPWLLWLAVDVEILAVVAQWRTPDHRYFRVRTAGETCTLRQDVRSGGWGNAASFLMSSPSRYARIRHQGQCHDLRCPSARVMLPPWNSTLIACSNC